MGISLKIISRSETSPVPAKTSPYVDPAVDKRQNLADGIKAALNASGHPAICTDVYFNHKGELIIEATSYWGNMSKNDRDDLIYLIKEILQNRKEELDVEGFGQFFSPAGRPLESFYAY